MDGGRFTLVRSRPSVDIVFDPDPLLEKPAAEFQESMESIREIPRETLWAFILAVWLAHVGLFAVSLGLLLIGFWGWWWIGGALVVGGSIALVLTAAIVRWHRRHAESE